MNIDFIRQFNGVQINIQTNKWRTALVLFCKGKVIGFVPCPMCNKLKCKYQDTKTGEIEWQQEN